MFNSQVFIGQYDFEYVVVNHLVDLDAKAFAEMLKVNETLEKLDLSHNSFGVYGGIYLGAGLVTMSFVFVVEVLCFMELFGVY